LYLELVGKVCCSGRTRLRKLFSVFACPYQL